MIGTTTLPTLTIPNGTTVSNAIGRKWLSQLRSLILYASSAITETITVEVTDEDPDTAASPTWYTLQSSGADVTLTAGKALVINEVPFSGMRLSSGAAVGADRVVTAVGKDQS